MKIFIGKKVGVSKEEKTMPYFKYFERDMAKIPAEKLALTEKPAEAECIPFEKRNLFLNGDDINFCQVGYGVNKDGIGFVCNETYMKNVTSYMLDWWFAWHSVGSDLRYKIWDSEDHYFARADKADYVCNPNVPMNEKTWGVTHYVLEDIGKGPGFLRLQFKSPADFGYDTSIIGSEKCKSLVSAVGDGNCPAVMTHKWYNCENGIMLCSRFWIGYGIIDNEIVRTLPTNKKVPLEVPQGLFAHNIKEFTNLASILPELYQENKDNI